MENNPPTRKKLGSFRPPFGGTCRARRPRPFDSGLCGPARPATHRAPLSYVPHRRVPGYLSLRVITPGCLSLLEAPQDTQHTDLKTRPSWAGTRPRDTPGGGTGKFPAARPSLPPRPCTLGLPPSTTAQGQPAAKNDEITLHVNGNNYK